MSQTTRNEKVTSSASRAGEYRLNVPKKINVPFWGTVLDDPKNGTFGVFFTETVQFGEAKTGGVASH